MSDKEFLWETGLAWDENYITPLPTQPVSREEAVRNFYEMELKKVAYGSQFDRDVIVIDLIGSLSNLLSAEGFEELVNHQVKPNPEYKPDNT
jgi:hypothetical protein